MENKLEILKMLEAGEITAPEAEALLEAMETEQDSENTEALREELISLRDECQALKEACEQARADCESLRGECENFMQEAEDYASEAEDYATQAEEYVEGTGCGGQTNYNAGIDLNALDEELQKVQTVLESLGIQCVDFAHIRKTTRESVRNATGAWQKQEQPPQSNIPTNNHTRRGDPLPHGFTLTPDERAAWYERRAADRKRRESDRKRREQDRTRRDGDRIRREETAKAFESEIKKLSELCREIEEIEKETK